MRKIKLFPTRMPIEKSAGAIIFYRNKKTEYLLLHYPFGSRTKKPHSRETSLRGRDYWDFPKGHIEENEEETDTVIREVEEETGLDDIKIIEGFKESIKYFFKSEGKTIFITVVFYLAEVKTKEVKISGEHIGYEWLPYEEALGQLNFKNAKEILEQANDFLTKNAAGS